MRFRAIMEFEFEADDIDHAFDRVKGLQDKVSHGAAKLGIGYVRGVATCQPTVGARPRPEPCPPGLFVRTGSPDPDA